MLISYIIHKDIDFLDNEKDDIIVKKKRKKKSNGDAKALLGTNVWRNAIQFFFFFFIK